LAARCATELVVVSEPLRDYFTKAHRVNSTFIPNAVVPIERREPNRIRRWNLRTGNFLLAASRLVPEKGLHYLIPAFESLETELKLVIAGGGELESSYEHELRATRDPRIIFVGAADRELLSELYSNALLFVLPSEVEGMSIALLEAMSCGLPVVVSDIVENACVVGSDGFTFRNRDVLHLRAVLDSLLDTRILLSEFGQRCRNRAARFQWPRVVEELERVYRHAAGIVGGYEMDLQPDEVSIPDAAQGCSGDAPDRSTKSPARAHTAGIATISDRF
jgi:glycosyltransferase involved in cell wall biosynthesis